MCPLLELRFPEFSVTITYSMGINMRFDFCLYVTSSLEQCPDFNKNGVNNIA